MAELLVDFITSLDGYGAAEGWPGWWGLQGPEYLAWLAERPERHYTILMGATTYRQMSGFVEQVEASESHAARDEAASFEEVSNASKVVFSSTLQEPLALPNARLVRADPVEAVLSEATVRSHLASIYSKLGVAGRVELLARLNEGRTPADVVPQSEFRQPEELTTTRVDALHRPNSRLTGWLSGLVVGAASGFLALLAGPLGLVPALGFVPVAIRSRQTLASLAGLLIGAGAIALGMITAANASCTTVVTPTSYSSCTAPDLTAWVMLAGVAVAGGALLSIAATRRT